MIKLISSRPLSPTLFGAGAILLCMFLRATDLLFRNNTLKTLPPLTLITVEHLLVTIALFTVLPLCSKDKFKDSYPHPRQLRSLNTKGVALLLFIACGSSVGGILSFTTAFQLIHPAVVILLQKLQPLVVIIFAFIFLKERPTPSFYLWATVALIAGYILSFGWVLPSLVLAKQAIKIQGLGWALLSVFLWGSGTVAGKYLLSGSSGQQISTSDLTKFRYIFGTIFALILLLTLRPPVDGLIDGLMVLPHGPTLLTLLPSLLYMSLIAGYLAIRLFYWGLRFTSSASASIYELFYPLSALLIGQIFLEQKLNVIQISAGLVLMFAMTRISQLRTHA
ncbi:MAG: EamA family transporter [Oligoflexia bacterium]|nr:EamA family transporter [Oligoflexia bacterium]